jgi:hypothetical protein
MAEAGKTGSSEPRDEPGHGAEAQRRTELERERLDNSLGLLMRIEAHRALAQNQFKPDPKRIADGWERRFVTDAARAEEAMALYRELSYEVCADPVRVEELGNECDACRLVAVLRFQTIYTRREPESAAAARSPCSCRTRRNPHIS